MVKIPIVRSPSKLYVFHTANLREIELAIGHAARLARAAISSGDPHSSLRSLVRLYAFLIGAWAECRLRKLLHEEFGFSVAERDGVLAKSTQLDQWVEAVNCAFRKHHGIRKAALTRRTLGVSHAARRDALVSVLLGELRVVIEVRNKLAHGQWVYPLNNDGAAVQQEMYRQINQENLMSLQFKFSLLGHLADAIHDLVVSPATFERDFDEHFKRLEQVRVNLSVKIYAKYAQALVDRRRRARVALTKTSKMVAD